MGSLCTPSGVHCRLFRWFLGKCFLLEVHYTIYRDKNEMKNGCMHVQFENVYFTYRTGVSCPFSSRIQSPVSMFQIL